MKEMLEAIYLEDVIVDIVDKYGYVICEVIGNVTDLDGSKIIINHNIAVDIPWDQVNSVEKELIDNESNVTEYTVITSDYSYVIDVM